jgi:hypothetical protein
MRKGIADLHRRTEVSQKATERLLNALGSVDDSRSVEELTAEIQKRTSWNGRKVRGLHPWGDDKELFAPSTTASSRSTVSATETCRRFCTTPNRIRQPRSAGGAPRRCQVTDAGRIILLAVLTTARTSINQINQLPKAA